MTTKISIQLNGEAFYLEQPASIHNLISRLGIGEQRFAVEVNKEIVPRGEHAEFQLKSGDSVEVVQAIGGG